MTSLLNSPTVLGDLPEDPVDGQVFTFPPGRVGSASSAISLYHMGELWGTTPSVSPMPGRDTLLTLDRTVTRKPVTAKMVLQIVAEQFLYNTLVFHKDFGWFGVEGAGTTAMTIYNQYVRVRQAVPVGPAVDGFYLYEKVCVEQIKGVKDE